MPHRSSHQISQLLINQYISELRFAPLSTSRFPLKFNIVMIPTISSPPGPLLTIPINAIPDPTTYLS